MFHIRKGVSMSRVKESTLAGMFYPSDPFELERQIKSYLADSEINLPIPKAIIAPHAGLIYSGAIAARAYACLVKAQSCIKQVVLIGPAHRHPVSGVAVTQADYYATPLGNIPIDTRAVQSILSSSHVHVVEQAYYQENAIEVQLPFFQIALKDFKLIPLLTGSATPEEVATVLEALWNGEETLVVVSSDLSHYWDYHSAKKMDEKTAQSILELNPESISPEQACGGLAVQALLLCARKRKLTISQVDLRNSGDTAGGRDQVVGYGAFHLRYEGKEK